MNKDNSIKLLVQVALLAQSKGILSLDDAVLVKEAITLLATDKAQSEQVLEEVTPEV